MTGSQITTLVIAGVITLCAIPAITAGIVKHDKATIYTWIILVLVELFLVWSQFSQ